MPELPDVEAYRLHLLPSLVGRRFLGVNLHWAGAVRWPSPQELERHFPGQRIERLGRRGKYLLVYLPRGEVLIFHLRMTGALWVKPKSADPQRFTRAVFPLDNDTELRFCDQRKLGNIWLVADESQVVGKLGPEPLDAEFTPEYLAAELKRRSGPIKALLCDQTFVAGIGNIYADEVLFAAGLHPLRGARTLSPEEIQEIHSALHRVLPRATRITGEFLARGQVPEAEESWKLLRLPRHPAQPCPICKTPIARIPLRKRGTYFCPRCQRRE